MFGIVRLILRAFSPRRTRAQLRLVETPTPPRAKTPVLERKDTVKKRARSDADISCLDSLPRAKVLRVCDGDTARILCLSAATFKL